MASKRKATTAIVAGATAAALLLGGTFAWTSISQQAKNEAAGIVNVGGRLHDDFDGENKDVYVENFTDPLNGGQPIYARIKLTEYMEIGQDAGGRGADVNGDGKVTAVPVVSGTSIDDKDNWPVHLPDGSCAACATAGTCRIHDHWKWIMGGEGDNGGQTTFMPTFNKDKDSLDADINGTYAGTNADDKIYYDDYVTYATAGGVTVDLTADFTPPEGAANASALTEAEGSVTTVKGDAYYDDDTDTAENDHKNEIGVKVETETHTAKQTAEGTVILMEDWNSQPGNYWVYDTDGWAYWANPIMPGEATGLLLDGINMEKNPGEKCYYAINVVGQFATVNDWDYFNGDSENPAFDGTPEAEALLETVSKNVATVTVTNLGGMTTVDPGDTVSFSANVTVNGTQVLAAEDFDWSVLNAETMKKASSTIDNGVLTVASAETSENLIVVAKAKDPAYLGALGMSSVAVNVKVYTEEELAMINTIANARVLGSAEAGGENVDIVNAATDSDMVTIDGQKYMVIARDDQTDGSKRALLLSAGAVEFYDSDNKAWKYVRYGENNLWGESGINYLLNSTEDELAYSFGYDAWEYYEDGGANPTMTTPTVKGFLAQNPMIASLASNTPIQTRKYAEDGSYEFVTTKSKVFLLSEADLYGTIGKGTAEPQDYTYLDENGNGIRLINYTLAKSDSAYAFDYQWVRSTYNNSAEVGYLLTTSTQGGWDFGGNSPQGGTLRYILASDTIMSRCATFGATHAAFWVDISVADKYQ